MRKYRRLVPGRPYTLPPIITRNFEEGVGYLKNFAKHNPVFLFCSVMIAVSSLRLGYTTYKLSNTDPDETYMYKKKYTVYRREDLAHPDKPFYN